MFCLGERDFGVSRANFLAALEKEGIPCSAGYAHPVYQNPMFLYREFHAHECPVDCRHDASGVDYATFEALCPNAERACREALWLEHRLLLGEREDMDDMVRAIAKIYECRGEIAADSFLPFSKEI